MAAAAALGQGATNQTEQLRPVVVTGSHIPTAATVSIPPVETYTSETIERQGAKTIEAVVKRMPSAVGGGNFGISRGNGGDGRAEISLRGVPGGTLVLINGRRTANQDLNAIPIAAVERIEILKDGGSSVYGADAVAGVVNVIFKKDFTGTQIDASYGNTTSKDAGEQRYSFITGLANEKSSLLVGGSYYRVNSLYSADRERSFPNPSDPNNTSATSNPGRIQTTQAPTNSVLRTTGVVYRGAPGTTGTSTNQYSAFSNATDRFPFGFFTPAIRDAERYSFFGNGEHAIFGDNLKFFAESFYTHAWSYNQLAPSPIVFVNQTTATSPNGFVIPADHPFNPFGIPIDRARYRPVELGPRIDSNTWDIFRFVGGLKGRVGKTSWNWEVATLYTFQDGVGLNGNDVSRNGLEQAIKSKDKTMAFNPFGNAANTAAALDAIRLDHYIFETDTLYSVDGKVNGELFDLPAGPVAVAVGGEHREERRTYQPDSTLISGNVVAFNSAKPYTGSRDVNGLFYEISIPVVGMGMNIPAIYSFEVNHSGRYEEYSDFGTTYNPKVGVLWKPMDEHLTLRASYSESFTTPAFGDLYRRAAEDYPELRNPVKFAAGDPTYFDQIRTFHSGNALLNPATAQNYTAGLIYSPPQVKGLTVGVDYFRIEQKDVVGEADQFILDQNFAGGGPANPNAPYASFVVFDPATKEYTTLYSPTLNLSRRIIQGLDTTLSYELATQTAGTFSFSTLWAYYFDFRQENILGQGFKDRLGDFTDPGQGFGLGSLPRIKGISSLFWNYSDFEFGVTANYIGSYRDDVAAGFDRQIDDWLTFDLQASYRLPWDARVTVGVINVADEPPPLALGAFADRYDRDTHDLRGRFVYGSLSKRF
jgi:iron complex outermembrane receptor protein